MYRILGSDQIEYGPVTIDQIRQWIAQGRINAQTRVRAEADAEWKTAQDFAELADALRSPTIGPPPLASESAGPARTSRLAIWSLVLGILGWATFGVALIITAPLGLVFGVVSMSKIRKSQGRLRGEGLALAGTIVSGISVLLLPILAILAGMLLPALAQAKSKAQTIMCVNNMKQLALAARIYATDNKDHFPEAANWCDAILPSAGGSDRVFQCPAGRSGQRCHYAFNAKLSGAETGSVTPTTVLFFEAEGGWNISGDQALMLQRPRHGRLVVLAFADGHVEQVSESRLNDLRWAP
jgi:prepilin-type processing-associated H-X9-DG protein